MLLITLSLGVGSDSACTFFKQLATASVATTTLDCLGLETKDARHVFTEIEGLKSFPPGDYRGRAEVCKSLCPDGAASQCAAEVACFNSLFADLDAAIGDDGAWTLSPELVLVVGNYCNCYHHLEDIDKACYDFVSIHHNLSYNLIWPFNLFRVPRYFKIPN